MTNQVCLGVVSVAQRFVSAYDGALSPHGISFVEFQVLSAVNSAPQKFLKNIDVAHAVRVSASGATRMLKPMEKIGLIVREKDERDGRATRVKLTEAGERVYSEANATVAATSERLAKGLSSAEQEELLRLVQVLG